MLFDPLTIRGLQLRNRIILAPMCTYSAPENIPTDWHLTHYGARALGGFGALIAEATAVVPEGRITPNDLGLWSDAQIPAWKRLVDHVHSLGGIIGPQLAHAGRKAGIYRGFPGEPSGAIPVDQGWVPVAPSSVAFPELNQPHALTIADIQQVVAAFAAAAQRALQAGADFVEIHSAHGYLLHQFLSPISNQRTDEYGTDFAGRTKLLLQVVQAVRPAIGELPLWVRISATDWVDDGWSLPESVRLAQLLKQAGVDLIDVSSGGNLPTPPPNVGPGYQVELASQVRSAGLPTTAVGMIFNGPQADQILRSGQADAICIGRPALHDPAWPLHAAASLHLDPPNLYPPQYWRGHA